MSNWNPNANSWDPRQQQYPTGQQYPPPQPNPYGQPHGYGQPQQQYHGMMPGRGAPMYGGVPQHQQYYPQQVPQPHQSYGGGYGGRGGHAAGGGGGYQDPRYQQAPPRGGGRGGGYGYVVDPNEYGGRDNYVPNQPRYDTGGYRGGGGGAGGPARFQDYGGDDYGDNWDDDTPIETTAARRLNKEREAQQVEAAAAEPPSGGGKKRKRKRPKKKNKTADSETPAPQQPAVVTAPPVVRVAPSSSNASTAAPAAPAAPAAAEEPVVVSPVVEEEKTVAERGPKSSSRSSPAASPRSADTAVEEKKEEPPPAKGKKKKGKKTKVQWDRHDEREHINMVLIGHVDAGKSTLSGQILLQLNKIDQRTIAKYEREAKERNRESWWIAYIMDEDDEERAKGKTVECGRAHFDTPTKRYTILDAPGHKNYVPNMISGAAQADVAILVISARPGEFEAGFNRGGQTQEHAQLAFTLGISRLIIVINKMDACGYSQERYDSIVQQTTGFLRECGFKEKYMEFLPLSGQTGANVLTRFESGICDWWTGGSLIETLDGMKKIKRLTSSPLRVTVLDRYKGDKGLTVIGKVEAGVVSIGTQICVMPSSVNAVVGTVTIDDEPVESAGAGENVLVTFSQGGGNVYERIYGGCVLSAPQPDCVPVARRIKTEIYVIDSPEAGIMAVGFRAMFHCHNVAQECEISGLPHLINRKLNKVSRRPPAYLKVKNSAVAELSILGGSVVVEPFDVCAPLGRFTLRDQGKTVVIGVIKEILE